MRRTLIAAAAVVLVASSLTLAQARGKSTPAAANSPAASTPAPANALDDATIVAIFDAANTADIETGRIAATRGQSAEVREFGKMLERDHTAVRKMGRDLAAKLGVTPTPPADDAGARDHAAALKALRAASNKDFDQAFLRHEVAFHASVINAVTTTLLPAIKNAELKELVTKVAPAFEGHRAAAENMLKKK
jgi:putative membrane protein